MRILIVDDDDLSLQVLKFALEQAGHEIDTARNGREASDLLRSGAHQIVISDWEMPEMSGIDLCRSIRAQNLEHYVYFVLLTSRDGPEFTVQGLAAGADDFITKPFDPQELTARIRVAERILSLESRDVTIFALAKLAESRDPETGEHLERVQNYSKLLAEHLWRSGQYPEEIDPAFVKLIYETSPLHDIGKVGIPDFVLLKPGRLSDEEFGIMKTHTTMGAQTLAAAAKKHPRARYLRLAWEIAETHHEKWNGTGYPHGLEGNAIPLSGRIVAVADVYDALVSKRVYKSSFTHLMAKSIIVDGKGTHFDPVLVDAFLAVEAKFVEVREQYSGKLAEAA